MASVPEWLKVFVASCAWALVGNLGMGLLPQRPDGWVVLAYAFLWLVGFVWLIPAATVGISAAGYMVRLTLGIWTGTAILSGLLVLLLS